MRNFFRWGGLVGAFVLAAGLNLAAQEGAEEGGAAPKISGGLAMRWLWNVNDPLSDETGAHVYDKFGHSRFMLNQVRLHVDGKLGDETEYHIRVVGGEDAAANASFGFLGDNAGPGLFDQVDVEEAYVRHTWKKGDKSAFTLEVGKKATYQGIEKIDPNENNVISRGYLYGFAVARTHLGIYGEYKINDQFSPFLGIINGNDQVFDVNSSKTVILGARINAGEEFSGIVSIYHGPETANSSENRLVLDASFKSKINDQFSIGYQLNYGMVTEDTDVNPAAEDESWLGIGIWPTYKVNDKWLIGVRVEYFMDDFGTRVGTTQGEQIPIDPLADAALPAGTDSLTYINIAVAPVYQVTDNFMLRGEVRFDIADEDVFEDDKGLFGEGNQLVISLESVWKF